MVFEFALEKTPMRLIRLGFSFCLIVIGIFFLCAILFTNICDGGMAVAAAVSFSVIAYFLFLLVQESDFTEEIRQNDWSPYMNDIPVISQKYKRRMKPVNEKRYYCGVNIDCSSYGSSGNKQHKEFHRWKF